ncbi:MAG: Crp/Fnr family transcriptional regulator [Erythrobacter sp.]|nr:MAG: Crp/Fnr family transcriptional regulator [Erythrobacter sp.]
MATRHPLELLVRSLELRSPFSEDDRQALLALPHNLRTLESSSYLVREGEPPTHCGVLVSGYAYRQKITRAGTRQIIAIHIPGDAVDFQNLLLDTADHSVQMLTRGEVALVPRDALRDLTRSSPQIGEAIFVKTLVEAAIFREWVVNVGRRQAPERIAHILCELGCRLDAMGLAEGYGYTLPMTQEELGDAAGLTPVHVNRTLKILAAAGLIVRDRRSISFPDWRKVRDAADFNERYLHLGVQQYKQAAG